MKKFLKIFGVIVLVLLLITGAGAIYFVASSQHCDGIGAPAQTNLDATNHDRKGIMANTLAEVRNVSKCYQRNGLRIPVLENINLAVPEGEFLALMGPSGSGKSTLLNLIAGIDRPDKGAITVANNEVTKLSESQLANWRARSWLIPL